MKWNYHQIMNAIYRDRIYAKRTLELGLATGSGDDLAEIMVNLDDGTCTYQELIPVLEKVAAVDVFLHDEKYIPTEWEPDPDPDAKKSFKEWALKAIENIRKNANSLSSSTDIHRALTSNNPYLIRTTLDMLAAEGSEKDERFIPILEKIALKDEYKTYFSGIGYQTDCHLRESANSVIQMIIRNIQAKGKQQSPLILDRPQKLANSKSQIIDKVETKDIEKKKVDFFVTSCSICGLLPNDKIFNTGHLPDEVSKLEFKRIDSSTNLPLYCCPGCKTYYKRVEEDGGGVRLVRQSWQQSYELEKESNEDKVDEFFVRSCTICGTLPDDVTANTGQDFRLPEEANKLEFKRKNGTFESIYRCPGCGTYYERIFTPQMYGSGNLDEEQLIRLSWERSHEVDEWIS